MNMKHDQEYYSIAEVAKLLGLSRVAVYNRVKTKALAAKRFGRSYYISADTVAALTQRTLTEDRREQIDHAVRKVVKEYGVTLKLLTNA